MKLPAPSPRRGITLMEVLISIGILAIGLSSVVALVPAGKSEAGKAVMLDRASNMAMNVLNDAVTIGLTRPQSLVTVPSPSQLMIFDPPLVGSGTFWDVATSGTCNSTGIIAPGSSVIGILQGRDDLVYAAPAGEDDPPLNTISGGARAFLGRTSALVSVAPINGAFEAGTAAKVTAVVFHNRTSGTEAIVSGTYTSPDGTLSLPSLPSDRSLKEAIRPGTVVYSPSSPPSQRWYQIAMASVDEAQGIVYVTYVGGVEPKPPAGATTTSVPVQIAMDSVGLAERVVNLEGSGPYAK